MGLSGKVAIVTGATSGIGRATAESLAEQGVKVVGTGRRAELGEEVGEKIRATGGEFTFFVTDVSKVADCERAVAAAIDIYGQLDILINNAGTVGDPPIVESHDATEEWFDQIVDTNFKGAFFFCRYAIPHMRKPSGGVILNIASVSAVEGHSHMTPYSASKAALVQMSRTLAVEYVAENIRVNAVVAGGVLTDTADYTSNAIAKFIRGPDYEWPGYGEMARQSLMTPKEFGDALALLCDDRGAPITGATINMDKTTSVGFMYSTMMYMMTAGLWTAGE